VCGLLACVRPADRHRHRQELLKSSQHGSRDEAERKRKQEAEVNELRLALRLKNEEVLMLTDCGAAKRGKSSDDEADNAIMQEKMEELRQELFYSLAVGIKLNLSMQVRDAPHTTPHAQLACVRQMVVTTRSDRVHRALNARRASPSCTRTPGGTASRPAPGTAGSSIGSSADPDPTMPCIFRIFDNNN
jgi:hypothetical protein